MPRKKKLHEWREGRPGELARTICGQISINYADPNFFQLRLWMWRDKNVIGTEEGRGIPRCLNCIRQGEWDDLKYRDASVLDGRTPPM